MKTIIMDYENGITAPDLTLISVAKDLLTSDAEEVCFGSEALLIAARVLVARGEIPTARVVSGDGLSGWNGIIASNGQLTHLGGSLPIDSFYTELSQARRS